MTRAADGVNQNDGAGPQSKAVPRPAVPHLLMHQPVGLDHAVPHRRRHALAVDAAARLEQLERSGVEGGRGGRGAEGALALRGKSSSALGREQHGHAVAVAVCVSDVKPPAPGQEHWAGPGTGKDDRRATPMNCGAASHNNDMQQN